MKKIINSILKCISSFQYAIRGVGLLIRCENNMRYHLLAGLAVISLGLYLRLNPLEWSTLIAMIGLVMTAEAFNTAIEKLADVVEPNFSPKIGVIKDISAGAVLITSITAAIVGILILGEKTLMHYTLQ